MKKLVLLAAAGQAMLGVESGVCFAEGFGVR